MIEEKINLIDTFDQFLAGLFVVLVFGTYLSATPSTRLISKSWSTLVTVCNLCSSDVTYRSSGWW